MKDRRVMFIIPEMSVGGAQRSLAKISLELQTSADIFLVVFNKHVPVAYTHGGELISLEVYPGKSWLGKFLAFTSRIRKLKALKKKLGIDVAISFLEGADYVNLLSKQQEKVILSIRGSKVHDENMWKYFFWLRSKILIPWLYQKADTIIAVNRGIARELKEQFNLAGKDIIVLYNFYDFDEIKKLSQEPKEKELEALYRNPVIITVGRLASEKRLHFLLSVFAQIKITCKNARFILVGDGPLKESLLSLCTKLNLKYAVQTYNETSDVIFMNNQSNVFKYLNASTVYVMNSSSEGFPNGLVEAMICGVPVISSDCHYGPREILAPETGIPDPLTEPFTSPSGILMPFENSDLQQRNWAETTARLLQDTALRATLATNARQRAYAFSKDKVIDEWRKLISK